MAPVLLPAFLVAAQDKPPEKCTLSGSVVNSVGGGRPATTSTDGKGNFTLVDLAAGGYKLKGRRNGYLDTYYGARRAGGSGTTITLEPGVEMKDVQIKLAPFAVLSGAVRETDGEPLAGVRVSVSKVMYWDGRRRIGQVDDTRTDDLGQYRIANLEPGKYYIRAEPIRDDENDEAGVRLAVTAGPEVEGRVLVEDENPTALTDAFIEFVETSGIAASAPISEGHAFATTLSPGSYNLYFTAGKHLAIKSIRAGQTDVLRDGLTVSDAGKIALEIVLAPDGGQIEGVALDKDDKPVAGATVLLVPEPPFRGRRDRFADVVTDQYERYTFENVAPGDYKAFAWDDIEPGAWSDPDFFRDIESHGEAVKLNAKGRETAKVHSQIVVFGNR